MNTDFYVFYPTFKEIPISWEIENSPIPKIVSPFWRFEKKEGKILEMQEQKKK